jgi:polynucleotide 5'-hydroxyl-kinase GRC3/NOL9
MHEEILVIHENETLLVSGPASVRKFEGEVYCLGRKVRDYPVIVRKGRVLPFETPKYASVKLLLGSEASYEFQTENIGCKIWENDVKKHVDSFGKEIKKILILGGTDSGKTTLTSYLSNLATEKKLNVGIIDGDVGQADLTPPAFIGSKIIKEEIFDLRDVVADNIYPVGIINIAGFERYVIKGIIDSLNYVKDSDLIIINTDGYVDNGGIEYKLNLAKEVNPDLIFVTSGNNLAKTFAEKFGNKIEVLKQPVGINKSKIIRIARREMQYSRYLVMAEKSTANLNEVKIGFLGIKFDGEYHSTIFSSYEEIIIFDSTNKKIGISTKAFEKMFVGIEKEGKIKGFGVIDHIYQDKLRIRTPLKPPFETIWLSNIKLTDMGERKIKVSLI